MLKLTSLQNIGGTYLLNNDVSKSWFCVLNNPAEHGYTGTPQEICDCLADEWCTTETRTGAWLYCISADGLHHIHMVLEDSIAMRFSAIKKSYACGMHFEATKGNKQQVEDYINKRGKFEEKGEIIVCSTIRGEIKGCQGKRTDLDVIGDLINQGLTPSEILEQSFSYRRYETMIKRAFFDKRMRETPILRDVNVSFHCGESGSGKTFTYVQLCEKYGADNVYLLTDYGKGGFDNYNGQPVLCMDEFRGQIPFSQLMNLLDGYRVQIPCRYSNGYALWTEVHIFTVLPPEMIYKAMVEENRGIDTYEQLSRRIDFVVYHYCEDGIFKTFELPMEKYTNYDDLRRLAKMPPEQQYIPEWCEGEFEETEISYGNSSCN